MKARRSQSNKHIDREKLREKREAKEDLRTLLECGDEDAFVTLIKKLKPEITPAELVALVQRFREERAKRSRGL
jgi:succinate dehydrogenase flavin-adding protein (antitoxin of CptAB toxin-antitoxin module)